MMETNLGLRSSTESFSSQLYLHSGVAHPAHLIPHCTSIQIQAPPQFKLTAFALASAAASAAALASLGDPPDADPPRACGGDCGGRAGAVLAPAGVLLAGELVVGPEPRR